MVTLRCTQKLLRRLRVSPPVETLQATTALGDWYANLLYMRPQQLVVCMNERTLLVVLVPARGGNLLGVRFREAVAHHLLRIGVPPTMVEAEAREMAEVGFAPTASRKILGCLREAMFELSFELEPGRWPSLPDLEVHLSGNIYSTTGYRHPRDLALELFEAAGISSGGSAAKLH